MYIRRLQRLQRCLRWEVGEGGRGKGDRGGGGREAGGGRERGGRGRGGGAVYADRTTQSCKL